MIALRASEAFLLNPCNSWIFVFIRVKPCDIEAGGERRKGNTDGHGYPRMNADPLRRTSSRLQVPNVDVAPFFREVLGDQSAVTVMRFVLTA